MAQPQPDRRLREARAQYLAAVRRLDAALRAFDDSAMPMDPGPDLDEPYPWTAEHVQIISALPAAFAEVIDKRREWDRLRRERGGRA